MKKQSIYLSMICLAGLIASPAILACSQMSPESGFIYQNDKNQDGKLNLKEWQNIQLKGYFVAFRAGNLAEFKRLDKNKNRVVEHDELNDQVRYRREPCADWEEYSRKLLEEQNKQNQ